MEIPFNRYGYDAFGVSRTHLNKFYSTLYWFYQNYFRVDAHHIQRVPESGRTMLIGNHSGGLPVDAGMVLTSLLMDRSPPRLGHGMVEKFAYRLPFLADGFNRAGQFTGVPENCLRLLEDERLLMVFPEGARGTGKLYKDKYKLIRFGTGFMRLALKTGTPIIPFAFIGGEEALPQIAHLTWLAKLVGTPYWPVTPYIVPFPRPVKCDIFYGEPLHFEGDGNEPDNIIIGYVKIVKKAIRALMAEGLEERGETLPTQPPDQFGEQLPKM